MRDVLIIDYEKQINLTKCIFNPLNANITKWSKTLKQFVGKLPTNCLSVFGHFVGLMLKGLRNQFFTTTKTYSRFEKNLFYVNNSFYLILNF